MTWNYLDAKVLLRKSRNLEEAST